MSCSCERCLQEHFFFFHSQMSWLCMSVVEQQPQPRPCRLKPTPTRVVYHSLCVPPPSTFAYGNHCWMCSVTLESCIVIGLTNLVHFLIMLWHETQLHMYSEINCSTTKISGSCGVFSPSPYNGIGRYIFQRIYPQTHSAPRQSKEGE